MKYYIMLIVLISIVCSCDLGSSSTTNNSTDSSSAQKMNNNRQNNDKDINDLLSKVLVGNEDRKELYKIINESNKNTLKIMAESAIEIMIRERSLKGFSDGDKDLIGKFITANNKIQKVIIDKLNLEIDYMRSTNNASDENKEKYDAIKNIKGLKKEFSF